MVPAVYERLITNTASVSHVLSIAGKMQCDVGFKDIIVEDVWIPLVEQALGQSANYRYVMLIYVRFSVVTLYIEVDIKLLLCYFKRYQGLSVLFSAFSRTL